MSEYSTDIGIQRLQGMIRNFTEGAITDITGVLMNTVEAQLNRTMATAEARVTDAYNQATDAVEGALDSATEAAQGAIATATDAASGAIGTATDTLGSLPVPVPIPGLGIPGLSLKEQKAQIKAKDTKTKVKDLKAAVAARIAQRRVLQEPDDDEEEEQTGVFPTMMRTLLALQTQLPGVVTNVKDARRQISSVAATLSTIFGTFKQNGPPIFDDISALYRMIWVAYFGFFGSLTAGILLYGFWASGWFGGPKASVAESYEPPRTLRERCMVCCRSCNTCLKGCHDSNLCFWSFCLLMQVFVLVIFVISIVLCILTGLKAFIGAGCSQIYLLHDPAICTGMLGNIRGFLLSFLSSQPFVLDVYCNEASLLTCQLITGHFRTGGLGVVIGSMASALLSFLLILESAILHERARWKRIFDEEAKDV
jgi:hypothetical protein